jgi:hypothetical protein
VRQVTEALVGVERLQFRLQGVSDFRLLGIPLEQKQSLTDFTLSEGAQLLAAYRSGQLPAEFTLQIAVRNPNDGRQGRRRLPLTLTELRWRVVIDETPTVSGTLAQPVEVPGGGEAVVVPLRVQLDLYRFFAQRGYEGLLRLAMSLGGMQKELGRLVVEVEPTLSTPVGTLRYPQPVRIVEREFRP